jgi:putative ABC transport system permease protein
MTGLALGFAVATLIGLYVLFELSYNRWIPDYENIYKIEFTETEPGHKPLLSAMTPDPLANALVKDFPTIQHAARLKQSQFTLQHGENQFNELISFVDAGFFDVFDLEIKEGDHDALVPNNKGIAISETMALKYFGEGPAIGKILSLNGKLDQLVTAVFADLPDNTHLDIDFLVLLDESRYGARFLPNNWGSDSVHTYIKGSSTFHPDILREEGKEFVARNVALNWTELPPEQVIHFSAIPVSDIHLYSQMDNHERPISSIQTVLTFAIVAILILLLAGINFTNLSIAQAIKQTREIGVRKVLGARRSQLIKQFLTEALITAFAGLIIGLALAEFSLPIYNGFLDKNLSLDIFGDPLSSLSIIVIAMMIGLGGGIYPALILSGYKPSLILGRVPPFNSTPRLRNGLVILQFSVSITLMVATAIIYMQIDFVRNTDLGFDPARKIAIPIWEGDARDKALALKTEYSRLPGVNSVALSSTELPWVDGPLGVFIPPGTVRDDSRSIPVVTTDQNFFSLLEITPLAGRFFEEARQADYRNKSLTDSGVYTRSAVINETALRSLGFTSPNQALGRTVVSPGRTIETHVRIVGVAPDIHLESLYKEIKPMVFYLSAEPLFYMIVDLENADIQRTILDMENIWRDLIADVTFKATYIEQGFADLYLVADRQVTLFSIFTLLALLIASLGLYGLSAHMAESKTKEVGIRKVLGANALDIMVLFTWQFTKLVLVAAPIGILVSATAMNGWLLNFAYRLSIAGNFWVFALAVVIAVIIAWTTVGGHALRVARLNPVKALRME